MKLFFFLIFGMTMVLTFSMELPPVKENYAFFQKGTLPVLITAPHGGSKEFHESSIRKSGSLKKDIRTLELVKEISTTIKQNSNQTPYVVAALFSRRYIDANRPKELAFEDSSLAPIYDQYHMTIKEALAELCAKFPHGVILLDMHGQGKDPKTIHRGTKNGATVKHFSSECGTLGLTNENSFFTKLAQKGYIVFPPEGTHEDPHFSGGFTVREYGKGCVDAIQIEVGTEWREKAEKRDQFVKDFVQAFMPFLERYYLSKSKL